MASNEYTNTGEPLQELLSSSYEIVNGEPDVIGWDVVNEQGEKIGEVDDLLFSPSLRKVRYILVDFEDNSLNLEEERKVLIPIGVAVLHSENDTVLLPNVNVEQLSDLPHYIQGKVTAETELRIRRVFEGNGTQEKSDNAEKFYDHHHFNESNFYGTRRNSNPPDENQLP